jgi:hypothetical protein
MNIIYFASAKYSKNLNYAQVRKLNNIMGKAKAALIELAKW